MHLPTLVFLSLMINLIVGVLLVVLYRRKSEETSFAIWSAAAFLFVAGGSFSLLRETGASYLLGYFLADWLLVASAGLVLAGVLRFNRYRPDPAAIQHIFTAICLATLVMLFVASDPVAITVISSALVGLLFVISGIQAGKTACGVPDFGKVLRTVFSLHAGIMFLQAIIVSKHEGGQTFEFSHWALQFTFVSHLLLTIFTVILLPWMAFFREERRLSVKSQIDGLTRLANREYFFDCLEQHWNMHPESSTVVMMADIDHFKAINDNFGHAVGDHVIREVASAIVRSLRRYDLTGRVGGEEFASLLPDMDAMTAEVIGQRVREEVESSVRHPDIPELKVTVSIGMVEVRPELHPRHAALKAADTALYASKNNGRNRLTLGSVS